MRIGLLGAFEACDDAGQPVQIPGTRLRALLARLAVDQGHLVTTQSLVDAIWGERPPSGAGNALHSLVSRLRRALPPGDGTRVESLPAGYRLSAATEATDVARFERLAAEGRAFRDAGNANAAADRFASALGLWRGAPLADLAGVPFAGPTIARLTELRLRTIEDNAELALASGQAGQLIGDLQQLTVAHSLDERLRGLYIRALCAVGRPAEALSAFEDLRRQLAESLGTDPSPTLRDLHAGILRGGTGPDPLAGREPVVRRGGPEPGTSREPVVRHSGPEPGTSREPVVRHSGPEPGTSREPARRTNLTAAATSFVGRDQDLAQIGALLAGARLVTLVGPGGVGKTRLAAELAAGWPAPDGAWLVELAEIRDPASVPAAVCAALRLPLAADQLVQQLRDRQLLIVLDNCEHLIDACARLAQAILSGCGEVRVLATSREPLTTAGERVYPVPPLPVPPPAAGMGDALDVPALRLFADRAGAAVFGFRLTAENLPAVAEICRRLDGLPLAIELACARLRTLPAAEIAARLDDRFRLLTGGSRAALPRHRTLLAVVEWSWDLFTEAERTLARRLAVFAGGATPEAAEAVCADERLPAQDVVGLLGALADRSFVELRESPEAPASYRMLDTIRAYAEAALAQAGETGEFRRAHARYFLSRAEAAEPSLRGSGQVPHLAWLGREHDNIVAALRFAVSAADTETAVRLVAALGWYWTLRGNHAEAAGWISEVLALSGADAGGRVPREAVATVYAFDAMHHFALQDFERGQRSAARAAERAEDDAAPPPAAVPPAAHSAGQHSAGQHSAGQHSAGQHSAGQHPAGPHPATTIVRALLRQQAPGSSDFTELVEHPDPWLSATGYQYRGFAAELRGDAPAAAAAFAVARDKFTAIGDGWGAAGAVRHLGAGHGLGGDHGAALAASDQAIRFADAAGTEDDAAWMRAARGIVLLRAGDLAAARADLSSAQTTGHALRSVMVIAFAETGLGEVSRHAGDLAQARSLLNAARRRLDEAAGVPQRIRLLPLVGLARLAAVGGELAEAREFLAEALGLAVAAGHPLIQDRPAIATVTEALADLALADGRPADAVRLLGYAAAVRGAPDQGNPDVQRVETAARTALDGEYDGLYVQAVNMSADAAVTEITAMAGQPG